MAGTLFTIERRKPVTKGGGLYGMSHHETLTDVTEALWICRAQMKRGDLGCVKITGHQYPPFSRSIYFAEDIPELIAALREAGR